MTAEYTRSSFLGPWEPEVARALKDISEHRIIERIWAHDHTVWKEDPSDIQNRLGWLHAPEGMADAVPEIKTFADQIRQEGFARVLLLGMGGSSLAPRMFRSIFGVTPGSLDLAVLDSTDPGAVLEQERKHPPEKTLFIVSTKSGGTVETLSFMAYFYNHAARTLGPGLAGSRFAAITDPGSALESRAKELGFRRTFLNDPEVGGRYSALTYFGLVPAALLGIDLERLLNGATAMSLHARPQNPVSPGANSGAWLGAVLGALAQKGRDKLTLLISPPLGPFGAWVEQLIAESTGKEGKGILPVVDEALAPPKTYARDRVFVHLRLAHDTTLDQQARSLARAGHPVVVLNIEDTYDLGAECFRWEMATAVAGSFLEINPFNQPNVEAAKQSARDMVAAYKREGKLPGLEPTLKEGAITLYTDFACTTLAEGLDRFLSQADPGKEGSRGRSYVAIQAYVNPSPETWKALQALRTRILETRRMATTLGYGPSFLHSTGQLHKGDGGHGLFIQILAPMPEDIPIPDRPGEETSSISFGTLKTAQALGDRQALIEAGRRVMVLDVGGHLSEGLKRVTRAVQA